MLGVGDSGKLGKSEGVGWTCLCWGKCWTRWELCSVKLGQGGNWSQNTSAVDVVVRLHAGGGDPKTRDVASAPSARRRQCGSSYRELRKEFVLSRGDPTPRFMASGGGSPRRRNAAGHMGSYIGKCVFPQGTQDPKACFRTGRVSPEASVVPRWGGGGQRGRRPLPKRDPPLQDDPPLVIVFTTGVEHLLLVPIGCRSKRSVQKVFCFLKLSLAREERPPSSMTGGARVPRPRVDRSTWSPKKNDLYLHHSAGGVELSPRLDVSDDRPRGAHDCDTKGSRLNHSCVRRGLVIATRQLGPGPEEGRRAVHLQDRGSVGLALLQGCAAVDPWGERRLARC